MEDKDLDLIIYNANQVITLNSEYGVPRINEQMRDLAIIEDGAVGIKNDRIEFVGSTKEAYSTYDLDKIPHKIDAKRKIVTPGFVDPHTHILFNGSRENELEMKLRGMSYLDILKAGGGILKTVRMTRQASMDELIQNGIKILDKMLEYGTTTIETKSGYGLNTDSELKSLQAAKKLNKHHPIDVIPTFLGAHAIPPEYQDNSEGYVDLIINEMIPKVADGHLAKYCDVFCEEGIFSIDQTKRILSAGSKNGLKPIIHIDEIVDTGGAQLAADMNAVRVGHLLKSNSHGLQALSESGTIAVLLPGTPFCLMLQEYAPARKMIDMNLPIAIATDLNPNCWTESMQFIVSLACYHMKLTPAEALTASTINAACAIEQQHEIGSIEVGKKADLAIFAIPNYHFIPYHLGVNLVSQVIKNGKIVIE